VCISVLPNDIQRVSSCVVQRVIVTMYVPCVQADYGNLWKLFRVGLDVLLLALQTNWQMMLMTGIY